MKDVERIGDLIGNDPDGRCAVPFPVWQEFFRFSEAGGVSSLAAAYVELQQRVTQSGIVPPFGTDGDTRNDAVWSPGVLPMMIASADWGLLEKGVLQRTRLLDAILEDTYGDGKLLQEGLLPPALVTGHPGYMRAMRGVRSVGDMWLYLVAFDVVKSRDGRWRVLAQHTHHPSGLGYLLENRLATSHLFPDAFSALHVQHVAASYRALLRGLRKLSPSNADARAVLLTPGSRDRMYCEHAYLARYLGLTLVESGDLTVRDNRLYLKTIVGLEPVGIVLQMQCDLSIDPLESWPCAAPGVPGIVQVVRAGRVIVANAPGSTFLESPGLFSFLPRLGERVLGEPLSLGSVPTHWCGHEETWPGMRPSLRAHIIKSSYGRSGHENQWFEPVECAQLTEYELDRWAARIDARPADYLLQEPPCAQWVPFWREDREDDGQYGMLEPRQTIVRVYAVADGPKSWRVIPGGLSHVCPAGVTPDAWRLDERVSIDTWVLSDRESVVAAAQQQEAGAETFGSPSTTVSSRAAENLFWLGRYTERAVNCVRLALAAIGRLDGHTTPRDASHLELIWQLCRENGMIRETSGAPAPDAIRDRLVASLKGSRNGGPGLVFNMTGMREAARAIRERLSTQHWQLIHNASELAVRFGDEVGDDDSLGMGGVINALEKLKLYLTAITGEQTDHMTRDNGWRLLSVGRNIDRLSYLAHTLSSALEFRAIDGPDGFELTLELFDSVVTYLSRFQRRFDVAPLVELLVLDADNPRSLGWVARTLRARLSRMELGDNHALGDIARTVPDPRDWSLQNLCAKDADGQYGNLIGRVRECLASTWQLSDRIGERYFTHASAADRSLSS
ncbi:circularly permuted type 2 ATP-grasp protein [Paraburkholderia sp. J12]|uniref:circularly permuted type 2 ATP-grasp protein n=1 Tax=Paraburkholderia sp. J12 TaxID=2805432 RepID=UPI002ABE3F83|nr:circularly permuted type 2 ATP-grasp protein [Paraburkholderia sp. J12]